jgi:DNA-binding NarL/FixJ family response regulator
MNASAPPSRIGILLVEDSPIVRAGVAAVLSTHPDLRIVGEADGADAALANASLLAPQVILLDWRLPGVAGDALCRSLRTQFPDTGLLVLTSSGDPAVLRAALEAGADGFLLKETDGRTLADAIRAVAEGRTVFDRSLTETLANLYRSSPRPPAAGSPAAAFRRLGAQELRLVELVAAGLTNKEIGQRLAIAEKTVKNNLTRIFEQLGVRTRVQAATLWLQARPEA